MGICYFKRKASYEMRISDWSADVLFRSTLATSRPIRPKPSSPRVLPCNSRPFAYFFFRAPKVVWPSEGIRRLASYRKRTPPSKWPNTSSATDSEEEAGVFTTEIGRASCSERVCQDVEMPVVAVALIIQHELTTNKLAC